MWAKTKEPSEFRMFVIKIWADHTRERQGYNEIPLSFAEYWHNYKSWLKEKFRILKKEKVNLDV